MEDYEQDYEDHCPKCEHSPVHFRDCTSCEDGYNDEYESDPINFTPGESLIKCDECLGSSVEVWCPKCGYNISQHNYVMDILEKEGA